MRYGATRAPWGAYRNASTTDTMKPTAVDTPNPMTHLRARA